MIIKRRWTALLLTTLLFTPFAALALLSSAAKQPENLGVFDGQLAACPETPNCVGTQAEDPSQMIAPIRFTGSRAVAMQLLLSIVREQPRSAIISADENYIHAEFSSPIFRFVDDVEFLTSEADAEIHFRSASRVGHSDLGVNRRRLESIRASFQSRLRASTAAGEIGR